MKLVYFRAFAWLRWRLFVNQVKRSGVISQVILVLLAIQAVVAAIAFFVGSFLAGLLLMPELSSTVQLLIWDGLVFALVMSWTIGLLNELQRSEALTLEKFLHYPVSLAGVFTLNYFSSLLSISLLLFVPLLFGLVLGQVFGNGPAMLSVIPLVAAFLFALTALTYQFQGWLASLMVNKRRRRTIIVIVTLIFVVASQLPTLINVFRPWRFGMEERDQQVAKQKDDLARALNDREITQEEFVRRTREIDRRHFAKTTQSGKELWRTVEDTAWIVNVALPPGWLPLGAAYAAEGNIGPAFLATLAFSMVGGASLWRAYRTVLRLYTGDFTSGKQTLATEPTRPPVPLTPGEKTTLLDRAIPGVSTAAAVVALASFRSMLRAPETKMLLLSPIIAMVVFGGLFLRGGMTDTPLVARPFAYHGGIFMILFTLMQFLGNQFGFDRAGFRVFVLSPAPRRDILLGKNLAIFPIVVALAAPMTVVLCFIAPLRIDHLLALPFQIVSMYFVYCMLANALSIVAPTPVASGSLKAAHPKGAVVALHFVFFGVTPMVLAPTLVPMGVDAVLATLEVAEGWPIGLALTIVECAAIVALYRVVLGWEGRWLAARELKILEAVTTKAE